MSVPPDQLYVLVFEFKESLYKIVIKCYQALKNHVIVNCLNQAYSIQNILNSKAKFWPLNKQWFLHLCFGLLLN